MTSSATIRLAGPVAAALVAAAGLVGLAAPASAAVCSTAGISAVADFGDGAGGGTTTKCDPVATAKSASAVFRDVGISVQRNPDGSVCKVEGRPADAQCGRLGTQYWALWWSDGKNGKWVYAQQGDAGLTVPRNGAVAWVWQGPSGRRAPGVSAPVVTASPKPTPKPSPTRAASPAPTKPGTTSPSRKPAAQATSTRGGSAKVGPSGRPAKAGAARSRGAAASASATPSSTAATRSPASASAPADESATATAAKPAGAAFRPGEEHGSLPPWVPVAVIVALAGLGGGATWWRRRA